MLKIKYLTFLIWLSRLLSKQTSQKLKTKYLISQFLLLLFNLLDEEKQVFEVKMDEAAKIYTSKSQADNVLDIADENMAKIKEN